MGTPWSPLGQATLLLWGTSHRVRRLRTRFRPAGEPPGGRVNSAADSYPSPIPHPSIPGAITAASIGAPGRGRRRDPPNNAIPHFPRPLVDARRSRGKPESPKPLTHAVLAVQLHPPEGRLMGSPGALLLELHIVRRSPSSRPTARPSLGRPTGPSPPVDADPDNRWWVIICVAGAGPLPRTRPGLVLDLVRLPHSLARREHLRTPR